MRTRTSVLAFFAVVLLVATGASISTAEVNVNIGVFAPPPVYRAPAPPSVIVIPGTYVYRVPDIEVEILFYHGYWYRPYEGRWYRGSSYNGPWAYIAPPRLPREIVELPPDYRRMPPGHTRIPYGQLRKNWRGWERERYWENDREWREGRRERGEGPGHERWENEHAGPPPGTPPGHGGTPPGHGGTPPGQAKKDYGGDEGKGHGWGHGNK